MNIHWNILDVERTNILPLLKQFSEQGFYLAGGTGLALQLGHRDSLDFDFFTKSDFNSAQLAEEIHHVFGAYSVLITQQETNTLSLTLDNSVQLSFLGYQYPILNEFVQTEFFPIASVEDIACMKLSALLNRSVEKDYVDLYMILQQTPLRKLLSQAREKYPSIDTSLILKSLVYFDDIIQEPILFKEGHEVSFEEVKRSLIKKVSEYVQ